MRLLQIASGSNVEVDSVLSLLPEMACKSISIGTPCVNNEGKLMTVLGLVDDHGQNLPQHEQSMSLGRHEKGRTHVKGLYYDPANPERQDIIVEELTKLHPTIDIDPMNVDNIIKSSIPFQDPNICRQLFDTAFGEEQESTLLLQTYVLRGIKNMLSVSP